MKRTRLFSILFLLLVGTVNNYSQSLEESVSELDEYFMQVMADWKVPHMAYGIVKDTQIVRMRGFGYRDMENNLPVDEHTLLKIASTSKGMTAVSFGILADQGHMTLDTPIKEVLPGFLMSTDYVTRNITPRDMLCNRTGMPRHGFMWYGTDFTREQMSESLAYLEPVQGFREQHVYTNYMYDMIAYLIEEVSGVKWEDYIAENLFDPLEMHRTSFGTEIFNQENHAIPYNFNEESGSYEKAEKNDIMYADANIPAGGINTSVREMCNYLIMHLNGGVFKQDTIVSRNFLNQAHAVQIGTGRSDYSREVYQYGHGFGWYVENFHGHQLLSFGGRTANYDSRILVFPKDSIGIILLVGKNSLANYIVSETLAERVIGKEFYDWNDYAKNNPNWNRKPPEVTRNQEINPDAPPTLELSQYEGSYSHPAYGEVRISIQGDALSGKRSIVEFDLDHVEGDEFKIYHEESMYMGRALEFYFNDLQEIEFLTIDLQPPLTIRFERVDQ
jgi:CubicO group peptidase (beta-lactamase class C family)